jgi:predicted RNA-binding Zn ribbon-like protein
MATVPSPAFVFVGGRPSLDLVGTFGRRHAGGLERIPDPGALARWFVAAGLLAVAPPVTGSELRRARLLREAIAVLVHGTIAGQPVDDEAVRILNARAMVADLPPRLVTTPDGRLAVRPVDGSAAAALAGIARDGVRLLGGPQASRIKECQHPDCSLVFLDETQSARRRWCSMERCGNLVKTAGYRARRRG